MPDDSRLLSDNLFPSIFGAANPPPARGRVTSLLDMLRDYASRFFVLGSTLNRAIAEADLMADLMANRDAYVVVQSNRTLMGVCQELKAACEELKLRFTLDALDRFLAAPPGVMPRRDLVETLGEIRRRAADELRSHQFLYLSLGQSELYESEFPIGQDAERRFPAISPDLSEAAKCLALERHTAAVFHFCRVLEHGLDAFVAKLKGTTTAKATWGQKLSAAKNQIAAMPQTKPPQVKKYRAACAVYDALDSINEAWRNPIAHDLGRMHTPDEARACFDRTKQVFDALLAFLKCR